MAKKTRFLYALSLALLLALVVPLSTLAQAQIVDADAEYDFGEAITFKARVQSGSPVQAAWVSIRKQGDPANLELPVPVGEGGELALRLDLKTLDPGQYPPRAFSRVDYVFRATLADGEEITSQVFTFFYDDNRFPWKEKGNEVLRVHWYAGDEAFAQSVLDAAVQGLQKAQEFLPLEGKDEINIYVYASSSEMQSALLAGQSWVAGQTSPDLGVAVVSLAPGRPETRFEARRQIPHELMHILLYQYLEKGYSNLPAWFNEGLASMAELNPNPDYQAILEHNLRNDTLIPIASLCGTFPSDISGALLAYAESNSFTYYLYRQFGSSGLQKMAAGYADGLDCRRGVEAALGSSLERLETRWLEETFGANATEKALGELLPWVALLGLIVAVPLGLTLNGLWRWRRSPYSGYAALRGR
jgi:hypothetical protein